MKRQSRVVELLLLYEATGVQAFGVSKRLFRTSSSAALPDIVGLSKKACPLSFVHAAKRDDEEDIRDGMAKAFQELDALKSLGDDDASEKPKPKFNDDRKGFANAMQDLEREDLNAPPPAPPEAEVKLYSDMVSELEGRDEDNLYSDMLSDMGGSSKSPSLAQFEEEDDDDEHLDISAPISRSAEDIDAFMNKALEEAVEEARKKTPDELEAAADNVLDDKEMMKEIEEVFEKANQELLDCLEVIRKEQTELAEKSAEHSAQKRMEVSAENAERLEKAEASMVKMLEKVNAETKEVEKAVADLKAAQTEISDDPLVKLKQGGIVKQGALAGTLLFAVRSVVETIAMIGPDGGSHAIPALIQGALAIACAAFFFLF